MDNIFSLSLPISLTNAALTTVTSVCMPVTIQHQVGNQDKNIYLNDIYKYILPIKIDTYSGIENKINSFSQLKSNWDGYGAMRPDLSVINNSIRFVDKLPENIQSEIDPETIVATPYGTIVFDFSHKDDLISIEIGEKNIGFFSEFSDMDDVSMDGVLFSQNNLPGELVSAFSKLYMQSN